MKRLISFFLAVLIGWGSVTQPARAFAPVAVLAAPQIVTAGGVSYALGAIAGVIGVTGLYMTIQDAQDNAVRIPVGPNANNQPPAPAAAATTTGTTQTAGSRCGEILAMLGSTSTPYGCTVTTTYQSNGTSSYSGGYYGCGYNRITSTTTPGCESTHNRTYPNDGTYSYYQPQPNTSCPAGYTMSGSTCVLQEARQATNDKTCDILVTNGQFATANDINCPTTVDGSKLSPMLRDGKVIAYGTNSSGQPLMWEVTPGAQTYTVKEYQQIQTPTQTQVKTTTVTVDAATSAVTQVQTQTSPGSLTSPATQTVPQTTSDPTTATNTPTVQKDDTKPADLQTCGLPGSPACNVNDDGFEGKDNFSGPKSQEISDKLDQNKTQLETIKDSVPSITSNWIPSLMPGSATACSPLTFDFTVNNSVLGLLSAPNVKLDICEHLDLVRSILGYMLGLYTVWYVWRRFSTANQGA